jgi:hypothetical protein
MRRYVELGDRALELVERAVNQTQTLDDAQDALRHIKVMTALDKPEPTKWRAFIDAVTAVVGAAARAESDDQREKLGASALQYLGRLSAEIQAEEAKRERGRGYFVNSSELAGSHGVVYLIQCFAEALANGTHINFEE